MEENLEYSDDDYEFENPECPYSEDKLEDFSAKEENISKSIRLWLKKITARESSFLEGLQEQYDTHSTFCLNNQRIDISKSDIKKVLGEKDNLGKLHGDVEIFYENGDYLWADFVHGIKEGSASIVYQNGDHYSGHFHHDQLHGLVIETLDFCDFHNIRREVFYRDGIRHGFFREFLPDGQFWSFGRYFNGTKCKKEWVRVDGNAFIYGEMDEKHKPHGDGILYFYPDLKTVLRGNFSNGVLEKGYLVKLNGTEDENGILSPICDKSDSNLQFTFDQPSRFCISKNPFLRDPYEMRNVFVKDSNIPFAGEGLWAKIEIKKGSLVALFNGVKQRQLWGVACQQKAWSDYRICCGKELDIDILPEQVSLSNYCATLAHKTCHSFDFNAHFEPLWHPRFGKIMSVVANKDIEAGEEILANYNYSLSKSPEWYKIEWFKHLRRIGWSEEKIHSWVVKEIDKSGIMVEIPPPSNDSDRFTACLLCREHVFAWDSSSDKCRSCSRSVHSHCVTPNLELDFICNVCALSKN